MKFSEKYKPLATKILFNIKDLAGKNEVKKIYNEKEVVEILSIALFYEMNYIRYWSLPLSQQEKIMFSIANQLFSNVNGFTTEEGIRYHFFSYKEHEFYLNLYNYSYEKEVINSVRFPDKLFMNTQSLRVCIKKGLNDCDILDFFQPFKNIHTLFTIRGPCQVIESYYKSYDEIVDNSVPRQHLKMCVIS